MRRRPPRSTRTDTRFPYTTLFRSATRELVTHAAPDEIGVSVSYPLPGTRYYEQVKAQLGEKTHWEDSGDLAMMFSGAYDSHFYRSFRDLLHEQVDLLKPGPGMQPRQYREACAALEARWDALMAGERDHRNPRAIAVASGKRSEEHTPELQSLMRISDAGFCLKKKKQHHE